MGAPCFSDSQGCSERWSPKELRGTGLEIGVRASPPTPPCLKRSQSFYLESFSKNLSAQKQARCQQKWQRVQWALEERSLQRGLGITKASRRTPGRERPATVAGQPWLAGFCWVPAFLPVTGCFIKHHQTPLEVEKYADSLCGR